MKTKKKRAAQDATRMYDVAPLRRRCERLALKDESLQFQIRELTKRMKSLEKANDYFKQQIDVLLSERKRNLNEQR